MLLCDCRPSLDLFSQVIKLLEGNTDYIGTDILARAHLSTYLVRGPDQIDKVLLLLYFYLKRLNYYCLAFIFVG